MLKMETRPPIRVLIVDDSAVMRGLLRMTLATCLDIELVGMAEDGVAGIEAIERLRPDLVLLDIEMPRMNGFEVLAEIRAHNSPAKVIICSTLTQRGASITLEALARGATDYVAKPTAQLGAREGLETLSRELLPKIRSLFFARRDELRSGAVHPPSRIPSGIAVKSPISPRILVVGASTGGPAALEKFLPALPEDFPLPVLIVQHMPRVFTRLLAERLNGLCNIPVRESVDEEKIQAGTAYLAPGDWHMKVVGSITCCSLRLTQALPEQICRPSVDMLFQSTAKVYGAGTLAVVLTGMGSDGLGGCRAIHDAGGTILVQDRVTSSVWGMPGTVAEAGLARRILPLESLSAEVIRLSTRYPRSKPA